MKKVHTIIIILIIILIIPISIFVVNSMTDEVVINDMLLYEHDNSNFYLRIGFTDDKFDTISIWIVDSKGFSCKDEPDPVYCSRIKAIELDYSSLPLYEVTNECTIIRNAQTSDRSGDVNFQEHDLYILNDEYRLHQFLEFSNPSTYCTNMFWQLMYEADNTTQAEIIEYADYDCRCNRYKFGPLYHATPKGQIQCIYKYGNKVYYRQIN